MCLKIISIILVIFLLENTVGAIKTQSYEDKRCKCICPSLSSVLNNTLETDRLMVIENVPPSKCNCDGVILPRIGDKIKGKGQEFCPRCQCKYENRNTAVIKVVVVIVIWVISLLVVYMLFLICLDPLVNKRVKNNYQEHTNEDVSAAEMISLLPIGGDSGARDTDDEDHDADNDQTDDDDEFNIVYFSAKDDVTLNNSGGVLTTPPIATSSPGSIGGGGGGGVTSGSGGGNMGISGGDSGIGGGVTSGGSSITGLAPSIHPLGVRGNVLNRVGHQQDKWKRQVREQRKNIYDRHTMLN